MVNISIKRDVDETTTGTEYGVELKEVDFKEFDRRKTPRMDNYESFVKSIETTSVEIEFIV